LLKRACREQPWKPPLDSRLRGSGDTAMRSGEHRLIYATRYWVLRRERPVDCGPAKRRRSRPLRSGIFGFVRGRHPSDRIRMPYRIFFDCLNLALGEGTGVATYARTLSRVRVARDLGP